MSAGETIPTRWAVDAGWGLRLWNNDDRTPEERDYLDQARVGLVSGFEVAAFPWTSARTSAGFGFTGSLFQASSHAGLSADSMQSAKRDAFRILYAAPAVFLKRPLGARGLLVGQAGAGRFFYQDESTGGSLPGVLQGSAFGVHAAGSAEFRVFFRAAIGIGVRLLHGELDKLRYNAIPIPTAPVSLTRADLTVGIRFYP